MTHCNAGGLATAGYGTALGVIRGAIEAGKPVRVLACETRPFLQGARLTAWELSRDGIPVEIITDSMGGHFLSRGGIAAVIVGADRIAANGDTANKIGTYSLRLAEERRPLLCRRADHDARPRLPRRLPDPIEERAREVCHWATRRSGRPVAARYVADVTPKRYISAIVTDRGVCALPTPNPCARPWPARRAGLAPRGGVPALQFLFGR
jgi:methylthioribose-1-phosphate isomerase